MNEYYIQKFRNWLQKHEENSSEATQSGNSQNASKEAVQNPSNQMQSPDQIVYEDDNFELLVKKGSFKRQKNFKLSDHLFYFILRPKNASSRLPLLLDILDFLHSAFLHVLDTIKTFYERGNFKYFRGFSEHFC